MPFSFHGEDGEDGEAEEQRAEQAAEDQSPHGAAGSPVCPGRQLSPGNPPQGHRVPGEVFPNGQGRSNLGILIKSRASPSQKEETSFSRR